MRGLEGPLRPRFTYISGGVCNSCRELFGQVDGAASTWVSVANGNRGIGRVGAVRSSAWVWAFSSMQTTTAFSGGFRYKPMTSRTLASNSGSVENLNVSRFHGFRSCSRQMRATEAKEIPRCCPAAGPTSASPPRTPAAPPTWPPRPPGHRSPADDPTDRDHRAPRCRSAHSGPARSAPWAATPRPGGRFPRSAPPQQRAKRSGRAAPTLRHPSTRRRAPQHRSQSRLITGTQHNRRSNRHTRLSQKLTVKSLTTRDTRTRWRPPVRPLGPVPQIHR